jgi:hypothetical protein
MATSNFDLNPSQRNPEMRTKMLAAVTAALLSCTSVITLAADERKPDATVELNGGSVAVVAGVDWAKGTLHFQGQDVPIKVKGLSLVRVGATKMSASGEVYNLKKVSDFAGSYSAVAAGAALAGGGGVAAMRNDHGVVMHLRSKTVGADLDLGVQGLEVSLDK